MPTECSPDRMEFARVEGRAVVAAFRRRDDHLRRRGAALGRHRPGDRPGPPVRRLLRRSPRRRTGSSTTWRPWSASACSPWRWATRTWSTTTPCATTRCWRRSPASSAARRADCAPLAGKSTLNRLEHAPAGAATRYHKIGHDAGRDRAAVRRPVPRRARTRRPRRSCSTSMPPTTRCTAPRRAVLPRLLWLLLLPAAVRLLRRPPAGGEAAAVEHRRQRRRGGGGRADRRPDPRPVAAGADRPARRFAASPARR